MAIIHDKEAHEALKKTVGRRLRAVRTASGIRECEAKDALGHQGLTQLSLAESGHRLPPLLSLIQLADLYHVPIDYLCGRIDDPIAESDEHSRELISRGISQGISKQFGQLVRALSDQAAVLVHGYQADRDDLAVVLSAVDELKAALGRMRELSPECEEEWRGLGRVDSALARMELIADRLTARKESERRQIEVIDKAVELEDAEKNIRQFHLSLTSA